MAKSGKKILAIVSRLPVSFDNRKDARFLRMLKYFSESDLVHLVYSQRMENDEGTIKELTRSGINVSSIREKRERGKYDLSSNMKSVFSEEKYDAVFLGGYYVARYYLPYVERHAPGALVLIDAANSQFVSLLRRAKTVREDIRREIAMKTADRYRLPETAVFSHADAVYVDEENMIKEIRRCLPGVFVNLVGNEKGFGNSNGALEGITKYSREKASGIDVVIAKPHDAGAPGQYEERNMEVISGLTDIRLRKAEGSTFAECFNWQAKQIRGKCSLFMDEKTLLNERTLDDLYFCLTVNPRSGLVFPATNLTTGVEVNISDIGSFLEKHYVSNIGNWEELKFIPGKCFMMNNDLVRTIGTMDERFRTFEYALFDYALRVYQSGREIIRANEAFVYCERTGEASRAETKRDKKLLLSKWGDRGTDILERLGEPKD